MSVRIEHNAEPVPGYKLLDRLGSGGFGEVWRAQAPGEIFKAIKIIHGDLRNRDNDAYRFAEQELKALNRVKQVRHPYLLAIDRFDIVEGRLFITMELADCNLWDRFRVCRKEGLPGIPREELLKYMSETAEVLDLFNDKFQLQHLDIKPQNLFMLHDHVKVADFGQVKDLENHMAQVTGGITPVYAAPETFDGFVSRYCDQYSLACVYQELLTGQRPFDGTSMQQLLMQHLQMPPNLAPSPHGDRPALARALSKSPQDRFPSVTAMVKAIREGMTTKTVLPVATQHDSLLSHNPPTRFQDPAHSARIDVEASGQQLPGLSATGLPPSLAYPSSTYASAPVGYSASTEAGEGDFTDFPDAHPDIAPTPDRDAPAEQVGSGSLRPTLVVGVGYTGMLVLQRLRKQVGDRFGTADKTPLFRTIYIDTDPDTLQLSTIPQPKVGLQGLSPEDVVPAKLQRATHYLKARQNGRTILDQWFDPQWLYKMPRNPSTLGIRAFGRLAFMDHYRVIAHKIHSELEQATDPQVIAETQLRTGLELSTNRPMVYVVAGVGGGTGSGMLIDLAYTVRDQLRRLGYSEPELVGVLLAPEDGPGLEHTSQALANTYATLTELHHFSRTESQFTASYEDRTVSIRDSEAPFSRLFLVPGLSYSSAVNSANPNMTTAPRSGVTSFPTRTPQAVQFPGPRGSGTQRIQNRRTSADLDLDRMTPKPETLSLPAEVQAAADFIRMHLFTQVGPLLNEVRPHHNPDEGSVIQTFGMKRFSWPRAEIINRTSRTLAAVLASQWVSPDPAEIRKTLPRWAEEQWQSSGMDLETLARSLLATAEQSTGTSLEEMFRLGTEQLTPKGWLARTADPDKTGVITQNWVALIGRPNSAVGRSAIFQDAFADAADQCVVKFTEQLRFLFPSLIENPEFRLAGAEEAIRQILGHLDRARIRADQLAAEKESQSTLAIDQLAGHANSAKGTRKLTATEFTEAIQTFPHAQTMFLQLKAASRVYRKLKDLLMAILAEVTVFRQRVEMGLPELTRDAETPANPAAFGEFLPTGCPSTEDAARVFLSSLTDADLTNLDHHVQEALDRKFGGLYQACLNSTEGSSSIFQVLREETRSFLDHRMGDVDLASMLFSSFGGVQQAAGGLHNAFEQASPKIIGNGPWTQNGINVFLGPVGAGGDPIRELAAEVLPEGTIDAPGEDEVILYREIPDVPLVALAQLGPLWSNAYQAFPESHQISPHTRLDVTSWSDVDAPV
ncbi:MAG: tubulin-like doman-containing protein [Fimbriiglobus sp.]